ncbi:uncharacterized protein LOC112465715 isoform X2 [Temnothorax curvispinosus]|uniref:Uncharacterized protein LOC112465715 isoform X2 n=1 Tax=Temnothorax curvispinosus TaxID=300111 RepID=A0A6J1R4S0_9HYME|nr:uncharacterized protein LOC112465715 isoform X2 [Temnothorax curvispinosus]
MLRSRSPRSRSPSFSPRRGSFRLHSPKNFCDFCVTSVYGSVEIKIAKVIAKIQIALLVSSKRITSLAFAEELL